MVFKIEMGIRNGITSVDMMGICMTPDTADLPDADPGSKGHLEAACKTQWRRPESVIPGWASYPTDGEGRKIQLAHHKAVKRSTRWAQSQITRSPLISPRKYSSQGPAFLSSSSFLWKQEWLCLSTEGSLWIVDKKHVLAVGIVFCLAAHVPPLLQICLFGYKTSCSAPSVAENGIFWETLDPWSSYTNEKQLCQLD